MNATLFLSLFRLKAFFILCTFLGLTTAHAQYDGGEGSEDDPWQIATIEQLQSINENPGAHFILTSDIDASTTADWDDGLGFEPIGDADSSFSGSLDGNGYVITDLIINREDENDIGLFGVIQKGTVRNVLLLGTEITGASNTGGLVGKIINGSIYSSGVKGTITGNGTTGGLAGSMFQSMIHHSYANAVINGENDVGGLAGYFEVSKISSSYSKSGVNGSFAVGGLIGHVLASGFDSNSVDGSYAAGLVNGEESTGGLVGFIIWGIPTSEKGIKDVTVQTGSSFKSSYWDSVATGQPMAVGSDNRWDGFRIDTVGLDTETITGQNAYINMLDFDFNDPWQLTSGYPVLSWQNPDDTVEIPEIPRIVAESSAIEFGISGIGIQKTLEFTIENTGIADLSIDASLSGPDETRFIIEESDQSLTVFPDDTISIPVHFTPETGDSVQAELLIEHDAPNEESPLRVTLSGRGMDVDFAGGSGTADDPWQIETLDQLDDVRLILQDHYILMNDLDASGTSQWNNGEGFNPIGDSEAGFSGGFDGNSYEINGLYIDRPDSNGVGLFGFLDDGIIREIILTDVQISGGRYTGSLVGYKGGGEVTTSKADGSVQASDSCAGGLIGCHRNGEVSNVSASVNVTGIDETGGLIGDNEATITDSWASGDATGQNSVGGLVGGNGYEPPRAGFISRSYATGKVTGETRVGGFAGDHLNGEFINVFATGDVAGESEVGGLIGYDGGSTFTSVAYAYAAGAVEGESDIGGIAGTAGTINSFSSVFWDMEVSGVNGATGDGSIEGVAGASTSELQQQATYEEWDFDEVWAISEGETYPWLQELGMPVSNESGPDNVGLPRSVELHQNYPNPFNPTTAISYQLPVKSDVRLEIFDIIGRQVTTLVDGPQQSGWHEATFEASNLASGVYFYRLQAGDVIQTRQMVLVK